MSELPNLPCATTDAASVNPEHRLKKAKPKYPPSWEELDEIGREFVYERANNWIRSNIDKGKVFRQINPNGSDCLLVCAAQNTDGYCRLKINGKVYYAHHVFGYLSQKSEITPDEAVEWSHLCHTRSCVRHIILESRMDNMKRRYCIPIKDCSHCSKTIITCTHTPNCLRPSNPQLPLSEN